MTKLNVDRWGAVAGTVCAVHCALTGLALGLLSVMGLGFIASPITEAAFVGTAVVLGLWALVHGRRRHHSYLPATFFALGLGCLVISHFAFGHQHDAHGHWSWGAVVFSVLGGAGLVAFHVLNQRLGRACGCNHCLHGD